MGANINYFISNNVNLNLLDDNVSLEEIDNYTAEEFKEEEDIRLKSRFSFKIDCFRGAHKSYINKIKENNQQRNISSKIGNICILAHDSNHEQYKLRVLYKEDIKLKDQDKLRKDIIKIIKEDQTLHALQDVILLYGGKLFDSENNRVNFHYTRCVKNLNQYIRSGMIENQQLAELKTNLVKIIDRELSKKTTNSYLYARSIETLLYGRKKDKKLVHQTRININNSYYQSLTNVKIVRTTSPRLKEEDTNSDYSEYGLHFYNNDLDYGFEEDDMFQEKCDVHDRNR